MLINDGIRKFLGSYDGAKFAEKHSLSTTGIWVIRGEDPNCDLGGSHYHPLIGYFKGTAREALEYGINDSRWIVWGSGGSIEKIEIINEVKYPAPPDDYCDEEYCG